MSAASGLATILEPVMWMGFGIGFSAGFWSALRKVHPGKAMAFAAVAMVLAIVAYSWMMPAAHAGAFMAYIFVVPFAGALPLGAAFYLGVSAAVFVTRRRDPPATEAPDKHEP